VPTASASELTPQIAAQELIRRKRGRESLIAFAEQIDIPGKPIVGTEDRFGVIETPLVLHHRLICQAIQDAIDQEGGRAIILMPPGSAKSTYISVVAPVWAMGRTPRFQVILTSYGDELAIKHSRRARQIAASPRFRDIFSMGLAGGQTASDQWKLENDSEYMASGILAGLTGNRGDLLIIDDPLRGREAAESQTQRDKVWDAYQDDARSRLKPGGSRVMMLTRWHEDDPAGRLLPKGWAGESGPILCSDGHVWNVICIPALADRQDDPLGRQMGEGLWPEWFGQGHWEEFKFPPRSWLSLYQQKPTSEQGTFFKREWFEPQRYDLAPPAGELSIYLTGDFAVTESDGDFTELGVWGVDHLDNVYALDWWFGQNTAEVWIRELLNRVERFKPLWFVGETGPIRRAVEPYLMKAMTDRSLYVACEWLPHGTANKEANARSFQALASVGKVRFPRTAWAEHVIDQLLRFPTGRHDDAVDACSLFGRMLEKTWGGPRPIEKKPLDWDRIATTISIADLEPNDGFRPYA